jgi:hypothetical protein
MLEKVNTPYCIIAESLYFRSFIFFSFDASLLLFMLIPKLFELSTNSKHNQSYRVVKI